MLVNYLMISSKWNFLAEGSLRSLPHGIKPYVIHVNKSKERTMKFKASNVQKQWAIDQHQVVHGDVLDSIWETKAFAHIVECDVLVLLDHDCYFGEPFQVMADQIVGAIASGCIIAGGRKCVDRFFPTNPMFAVKPIRHWPASWAPKDHGKSWFDTGQYIASLLARTSIRNFSEPIFQYHWGCSYHTQKLRKDSAKMYGYISRDYKYLLCCGKWTPSEEELIEMEEYDLLQLAVCEYRKITHS